MRKVIFFVDVDDTLMRFAGTKRMPVQNVVSHVRSLFREGAILYCWSSGGAEYACQMAVELQIDDCFAAFLPKPNVIIDDQEVAEWRNCLTIHPLDVSDQSLEKYLQTLEKKG